MTTKLFRFLMLSVLGLITFCAGTDRHAFCATQHSADECPEALSLIRKLRSADEAKRETAKTEIVILSNQSVSSRQCVIKKMLRIITEPITAPDRGFKFFLKFPQRYLEWSEATDVLATMRAMEAIDVLVDCLDCNDGKFGLGLGHFPAAKAIVKFGDQAIPKLEESLQQKPPGIRVMAVQALHAIGGEKVRLILLEALKKETDKSVADTIRNMLLSWNASSPRKT